VFVVFPSIRYLFDQVIYGSNPNPTNAPPSNPIAPVTSQTDRCPLLIPMTIKPLCTPLVTEADDEGERGLEPNDSDGCGTSTVAAGDADDLPSDTVGRNEADCLVAEDRGTAVGDRGPERETLTSSDEDDEDAVVKETDEVDVDEEDVGDVEEEVEVDELEDVLASPSARLPNPTAAGEARKIVYTFFIKAAPKIQSGPEPPVIDPPSITAATQKSPPSFSAANSK